MHRIHTANRRVGCEHCSAVKQIAIHDDQIQTSKLPARVSYRRWSAAEHATHHLHSHHNSLATRRSSVWERKQARSACTALESGQLVWAEQRLHELGFESIMDGKTKSYVGRDKDVAVFADPRFANRIDFKVYAVQGAGQPTTKPRKYRYVGQFWLMDSWRRDVADKFQSRLLRVSERRATGRSGP